MPSFALALLSIVQLLLLSTLVPAQSMGETSAIHEVGTFKTYLRLLAAEGDHVYVAKPGQCFVDLSLAEKSLRPLVYRCPSGETVKLVKAPKRFYWVQPPAKHRNIGRLYTCEALDCAARLIGTGNLSSPESIFHRDGKFYASFGVSNQASSTVVEVDDDTGALRRLPMRASLIASFVFDGKDIYYYSKLPRDRSAAIWRQSANDNGHAERVAGVAGVPDMKFESWGEDFDEIHRGALEARGTHFARILGVDKDRLYWEDPILRWWSKSQQASGTFTYSDGKQLLRISNAMPTEHYFYFQSSGLRRADGTSIIRVSKQGGAPETLVAEKADIGSFLVADGRLIWSVLHLRDVNSGTTTIRWIDLPREDKPTP
jgi:hypothetical protein